MQNLLKLILAMAVIGFFTACDNSDDPIWENETSSKHHLGKELTLGFNILIDGEYLTIGPDSDNCPGLAKVTHQGEGTGTHFKKLTSYFEFCVNPNDGTYPYDYMIGIFTDENGDELYVEIPSGQVINGRVPGMPSYAVSYFKDEFEIIGGTGKFDGATGGGFTNDYNYPVDEEGYIYPNKTRHHWQGTITLIK